MRYKIKHYAKDLQENYSRILPADISFLRKGFIK